jgi:hypothetical protein
LHARLANFTNRDWSRADELIGVVRQRFDSDERPPGAARFLLFVDHRGAAVTIAFFESEDALAEAKKSLESLEQELPEGLLGRRFSLGTYEVTIDDVAEGARAARITSLEGDPHRIDEDVRFFKENVLPEVADLTGWRGVIALADRSTGSKKIITFWDSDESLRASSVRTTQLGIRAAAALGDAITGVEHFAVAVQDVAAPV